MQNQIVTTFEVTLLVLNALAAFVPFSARGLRLSALAAVTPLILLVRYMKNHLSIISRPVFLFFFCLLPGLAIGQTDKAAEVSPAALPGDVLQMRQEAYDAIYNLDYPAARAKAEEIRKRLPDHPAGDLYIATLIWLEELYKGRRLQTGLYQNDSFYAGADKSDEKTEGDKVDPVVDRQFRDTINRAKTKALVLVNRTNKKDPDALYFLGAVYGVMGGYDASVARRFIGAMRNGSRGVDYHEQVLKLDPDYYDAAMSVGLYNYIVGSLPFVFKALVAFVGVRGSKTKGLALLEEAMNKGRYVNDDARVILIALYQKEKRPEDALKLLQNLSSRYPRNYLIRLETASTLSQLGRFAEATAMYEDILKVSGDGTALDLIHYQYAESLAKEQEFEKAAQHFLTVTKTRQAEAGLITLSFLRAGQMSDLAGKRTEAVAHYKTVLARPNVYDSREQAERGIKKPFRDTDGKKDGEE